MISLNNDFANFTRKTDARINLLKEIIDRVQRGENVDVEDLLGTGNAEKEQEWESGSAPIMIYPEFKHHELYHERLMLFYSLCSSP